MSSEVSQTLPAGLQDPWSLVRLAMGSLAGESARLKQALSRPTGSFELCELPEGSSWWEQFRRTQTYDKFTEVMPFRPNSTNSTVDLVLATGAEDLRRRLPLDGLMAQVEVFSGFSVEIQPQILALEEWAHPRTSPTGVDQVGAHYVLAHMKSVSRSRSACTLVLTTKDLYPPRTFEFVTGMTDPIRRVGVYSTARYFRKDGIANEMVIQKDLPILLVKVLSREVMKLCGMGQCCLLKCLMNPVPDDEDSGPDAVSQLPLNLCCICLRKLHWLTQADLLDRYGKLPPFMSTLFMEECEWIWRRMKHVGMPTSVLVSPEGKT